MQIHEPSFVAAERSSSTLNPDATVNSSAGVAAPFPAVARHALNGQRQTIVKNARARAGCRYFVSNAQSFSESPKVV